MTIDTSIQDWLDLAGDPEDDGLYFLGAGARRITFYCQQVRALRLAHALIRTHKVSSGDDVAVIGAGASGMTAAVALALAGATVTLYDPAAKPLSLQSASERLLHPHIYEWPMLGSLDDAAGLPVLDWSADTGGAVCDGLQKAFEAYDTALGNGLCFEGGRRLKALVRDGSRWRVSFEPKDGKVSDKDSRLFKTVVLAMGFGEETACAGAELSRYWKTGSIDAASDETDAGARYLISGAGDGGLTDLMALLIRNFQHVTFAQTVLAKVDEDRLSQAIEAACAGATLDTDLKPAFDVHVRPLLADYGVLDHLEHVIRTDRTVTINSERPLFAHGRAARLNQLLAYAVVEASARTDHAVTIQGGRMGAATVSGTSKSVAFETTGGMEHVSTDRIICRHGPATPKLYGFAEKEYVRYGVHRDAAIAAKATLVDPPALAPETFAFFEALDIATKPVALKTAMTLAATKRDATVRISRDAATSALVQIGPFAVDALAAQCEQLGEPVTLHLDVSPGALSRAEDWTRLACASGGKLQLVATDGVLAEWRQLDVTIQSAPIQQSRYHPVRLGALELSEAVDDCLLRLLDVEVQKCLATNRTDDLGAICPSIVQPASAEWASWRADLEATPALKASFLRWLFSLEPANDRPWTGSHHNVSMLGSALVLMLATNLGEPLRPNGLPRGNLGFAKDGMAVGSGCSKIESGLVTDWTDPDQWGVEAAVLAGTSEVAFIASSDRLLDGGDRVPGLRGAGRVEPAVVQNSAHWRQNLAAGLTPWRAAVHAEFERLRDRQDKLIKTVTK